MTVGRRRCTKRGKNRNMENVENGVQPQLSKRAQIANPFRAMVFGAMADEMIANGTDVVKLSLGEPDFGAPPAVRDAMREQYDGRPLPYTAAMGLPELRQAQKCKVAISVLFHVLRVWKPIFEKAAPEQYTKICKWLAVVATGYAARAKRRREVEYALEKMENRLRPYLKKTGLPPERRAFLACAMLAAALTLMDDARATCPLYARTGAWRYACQTTDTLVTALMRAFPGCDERGTEIYFDLTR